MRGNAKASIMNVTSRPMCREPHLAVRWTINSVMRWNGF